MDTLPYANGIIGICKGSFKDLGEEGLINTYYSYDQLISILNTDGNYREMIERQRKDRFTFLESITWNNFAKKIYEL